MQLLQLHGIDLSSKISVKVAFDNQPISNVRKKKHFIYHFENFLWNIVFLDFVLLLCDLLKFKFDEVTTSKSQNWTIFDREPLKKISQLKNAPFLIPPLRLSACDVHL